MSYQEPGGVATMNECALHLVKPSPSFNTFRIFDQRDIFRKLLENNRHDLLIDLFRHIGNELTTPNHSLKGFTRHPHLFCILVGGLPARPNFCCKDRQVPAHEQLQGQSRRTYFVPHSHLGKISFSSVPRIEAWIASALELYV
jgi:hypothetical protein